MQDRSGALLWFLATAVVTRVTFWLKLERDDGGCHHCTATVSPALHRRGWPEFFKAARLATAKQMTSCILKICKNELKHVDNKDKKTVNARAKAKVKAKAKLKD